MSAAEKVILRPVDISILREGMPLGDRTGCQNPRPSAIWEARFDWTPGLRSEDYRSYRGYGETEKAAVADLFKSRDSKEP